MKTIVDTAAPVSRRGEGRGRLADLSVVDKKKVARLIVTLQTVEEGYASAQTKWAAEEAALRASGAAQAAALKSVTDALESTKAAMGHLRTEDDSSRRRASAAEAEARRLKVALDGAAARLRDVEAALREAESATASRDARVAVLERRNDHLRRQNGELTRQNAVMRAAYATLERRSGTAARQNGELRLEGEEMRRKLLLALALLDEYQGQLVSAGTL